MNKRNVKNIFLILTFVVFIFIYFFINNSFMYKVITPVFLIVYCFITIVLLGFRICPNKLLENKSKSILVYEIIMYLLFIYFLGTIFGFNHNNGLFNIIENIIPVMVFIFTIEIIRYIIINSNKDKFYYVVIITLLITILETLIDINTSDVFIVMTKYFLPLFIKNSLLSFFTYNIGYNIPIIYRLLIDLSVLILPIYPDFSYSFQSIFNIILNAIMYITLFNIMSKREYVEPSFRTKKYNIFDFIYTIFIIFIVSITSGIFEYTLIAVGSNSMFQSFKRGDAILIDKSLTYDDLRQEDIVVINDNNDIYIERIIKVDYDENIKYFYTKDDKSKNENLRVVRIDDIEGKVLFSIPYIGYFNVLVEEYRSGDFEK